VILSESSVGAGSRRIEAVTAGEAFAYLHEQDPSPWTYAYELERARKEGKRTEPPGRRRAHGRRQGGQCAARRGTGDKRRSPAGSLRPYPQQEKADGAIVVSVDDGRAYLVINFDQSLVERGLDASQAHSRARQAHRRGWRRKPTLAEAGGKNPEGARDALDAGKKAVAAALA